jgi:hypothetical protein
MTATLPPSIPPTRGDANYPPPGGGTAKREGGEIAANSQAANGKSKIQSHPTYPTYG